MWTGSDGSGSDLQTTGQRSGGHAATRSHDRMLLGMGVLRGTAQRPCIKKTGKIELAKQNGQISGACMLWGHRRVGRQKLETPGLGAFLGDST